MVDVGAVVAGYRLVELQGNGPFGHVFRAEDARGGTVAMKLLKPGFLARTDGMGAFERLSASLAVHARLHHPYLARLTGSVDEPSSSAFGQLGEFLAGTPLTQAPVSPNALRGQDPLGLAVLLTWYEQLGDVLSWLHGQGMVHGNLKPSNVMLMPLAGEHHVKLLDLSWSAIGVAAVARGPQSYVSPEQYLGSVPTARSDQWSLGTMLERTFTGGRHQLSLGVLPAALVQMIQRATHEVPDQRFAQMGEFVEALREIRLDLQRAAGEDVAPAHAVQTLPAGAVPRDLAEGPRSPVPRGPTTQEAPLDSLVRPPVDPFAITKAGANETHQDLLKALESSAGVGVSDPGVEPVTTPGEPVPAGPPTPEYPAGEASSEEGGLSVDPERRRTIRVPPAAPAPVGPKTIPAARNLGDTLDGEPIPLRRHGLDDVLAEGLAVSPPRAAPRVDTAPRPAGPSTPPPPRPAPTSGRARGPTPEPLPTPELASSAPPVSSDVARPPPPPPVSSPRVLPGLAAVMVVLVSILAAGFAVANNPEGRKALSAMGWVEAPLVEVDLPSGADTSSTATVPVAPPPLVAPPLETAPKLELPSEPSPAPPRPRARRSPPAVKPRSEDARRRARSRSPASAKPPPTRTARKRPARKSASEDPAAAKPRRAPAPADAGSSAAAPRSVGRSRPDAGGAPLVVASTPDAGPSAGASAPSEGSKPRPPGPAPVPSETNVEPENPLAALETKAEKALARLAGPESTPGTAIARAAAACESGDAAACMRLGQARIVASAVEASTEAFERACTLGVSRGCLRAAGLLSRRAGRSKDALRLYGKACEGGLAEACVQAERRASGREAARWAARACALGVKKSCARAETSTG